MSALARRSHPGLSPPNAVAWLVRLRWVVVLGQIAVGVLATVAFDPPVFAGEILALVTLTAASNLAAPALAHRFGVVPTLGSAIGLDIVVLTALLALAGGPASHFSVLYLVPVALAALVLGAGAGFLAVAFGALCYASLFLLSHPAPHVHGDDHGLGIHILAMWIATALVAAVIAAVVGGIASALRRREDELRRLEALSARNARLVSLSTLAAGAAHELGSPLATIAVAARELERGAASDERDHELVADARLIREQVERCRVILSRMGDSAGSSTGESPEIVDVQDLLSGLRESLAGGEASRVVIHATERGAQVFGPRLNLGRALGNLVRNALDASAAGDAVDVSAASDASSVRLTVRDHGTGMTPPVLARASEPFFTTRPPGAGQGLGLFLARAVAEQLGGGLRIDSEPGAGTTVTITLPRHSRGEVRVA